MVNVSKYSIQLSVFVVKILEKALKIENCSKFIIKVPVRKGSRNTNQQNFHGFKGRSSFSPFNFIK